MDIEKNIKLIELVDKALNLSYKVAFTLGSFIVTLYFFNIKYIPHGLKITDTFLFIFIAFLFGYIYIFYITSMTCLAVILSTFFLYFKSLLIRKSRFEKTKWLIFKPGSYFITSMFAFVGLCIIATIILLDAFDIQNWTFTILSIFGISFVSTKKVLETNKLFFFSAMIFLITGVPSQMATLTMLGADVKARKAIVHIEKPYIEQLNSNNIPIEKSNFGPDHAKVKNVDVLLTKIGEETLFEVKNTKGETKRLKVPNKHIRINPIQ